MAPLQYIIRQLLIQLVLLSVFVGCQQTVVYHEILNIPSGEWHYKDGLGFDVHIEDTLSLHELYLDIRNQTNYPYSNIFLFLEIQFPDGRSLRDTIECILADQRGDWTGKGVGKLRSNRFLFRDDVWFPVPGTYSFQLYHGMRDEQLHGISDAGIRIRKK